MPRPQILQTARGAARSAAPGISISVNARHLVRSMWTLRVTGRRRTRRATVSTGRGWFARNRARQPLYSSAPDQAPRHRRIARRLERRIEQAALRTSRRVLDPDRVGELLRPDIRRLEAAPQPRPLLGLRTDVDEARPRHGRDEQGRFALGYHLTIEPNNFNDSIWARLGEPDYTGDWANWNTRHDLLVFNETQYALGGSPHDFGPYDLRTPRWDRARHEPVRDPRFELRPEYRRYGGIGGANGRRRWAACTHDADIRAERLHWSPRERRFERRQLRQDLVNERLQRHGMFAYMENRRDGEVVGRAVGSAAMRAQGIAGHRGGQEPRPLQATLQLEDGHRDSHIADRHVIGPGGIPSRRHVAWRAAFDEQIGAAGLDLEAVSSLGFNGAFETDGAAMEGLRHARNRVVGRWGAFRDRLLPDTPLLEFTGTVPVSHTFSVTRIDGRHPESERPRYLQPVFRGVFTSRFRGVRPLYDTDVNSREWITWATRHPHEAQPNRPLTRVVRRTRAFFLIRATAEDPNRWRSWFFVTLYPVD